MIETSYPGRYSSGKKVVVVGSIYFLFLVAGTFVFQHIEKEGVEQRCSVAMNKTNEYKVNGLSNSVIMIDVFKVEFLVRRGLVKSTTILVLICENRGIAQPRNK